MPMGPGKYDEECSWLREKLDAEGVVILVFRGREGGGFSAQLSGSLTMMLPTMLREMADEIERSGPFA